MISAATTYATTYEGAWGNRTAGGVTLYGGELEETKDTIEAAIRDVENRIARLSNLQENWDFAGAQPVEPHALSVAHSLIKAALSKHPTLPQPFIAPLSYGGVQLDWHRTDAAVEIEISPGGQLAVTFEWASQPEKDWDREFSLDKTYAFAAIRELLSTANVVRH